MIIFRPPTEADIDYVAANMRAQDALECWIVAKKAPREAIVASLEASSWAFAAEIEDEVIAIFGVAPEGMLSDDGAPWMLGTHGIEKHAREVLVSSLSFRNRMLSEFERLANVVHAHNRTSIRYLKWCGFSFGEPFDLEGEPFVAFEMKRAA